MVPPPVIAANRALLQVLVASNLFGQNTPTIAATETLYAEMWAQDATAMYGYASASAAATTVAPFTPAPQTTSRTSSAAVTQTAATQFASATAQGLTSPAAATDPLGTLADLIDIVLFLPNVAQAGLTPLNTTGLFTDLSFDDSELRDEALKGTEDEIAARLGIPGYASKPLGDAGLSAAPGPTALGQAKTPSVTAGLTQAGSVGRLSVPQAWTVAAPEIRLAALTLPTATAAVPEVMAASSPGSLFGEMTLANMVGHAMSGTANPGRRQERISSATCARPVSTTPASPSEHRAAIAADIHEFAEALIKLGDLRDCGLLTDEEFGKEKERLLTR